MVDVADARVVAILTRAPASGGKTRLFSAIGRPVDPALLEALLLDTLDGATVEGASTVIAVDPPEGCGEIRRIVRPAVQVFAQPDGTLGERMRDVMASLFDSGARAVALVGSDLPRLQPDTLVRAFDLLDADPECVVIGPATDGGYYLIASTRVPDVFGGVSWGSGRVFDETLAAARRAGLRVRLLDALSDVDDAADLQQLLETPRFATLRTARWWARAKNAANDSLTNG